MNSYIIAGRASVLDTIIELHNETYAAQNGDGGKIYNDFIKIWNF